jgi:hypothetical protein
MKSKIFEVSKHIPGTHVVAKGKKKGLHEPTLRNHLNEGEHTGDMLDDPLGGRHDLDAHEIETDIMDR